jgi:glycolate oxidase FAD binding subunit
MIAPEQLERLRDAVGADGFQQHEPLELDGVTSTLTLRPSDGGALSSTLAALASCSLSALIRGGGHRAGVGNPPTRADAFLSTDRLIGIDEFDASEGVCRVRSGTPIADVRDAVNAQGWELPLDPPGPGTTVGGCLAAASVGPRALGFGRPRDVVLGLEVCLASGQRIRCGGRVVKNVTGYDLNKLFTGSFGTLGVIEGAWLRLRARPDCAARCEARASNLASACRMGIAAAQLTSARAAAIRSSDRDGWRLVVELAGDEPTVQRDLHWLRTEYAAREAPESSIDRLRELQAEVPAPSGLRFRFGALPSRLEEALVEIRKSGASILAYPGLRLIYARFALTEPPAESEVDAAFHTIAKAARRAGGHYVCEAAPSWAKPGRDMFGEIGAAGSIMRALKERFDPGGVLNPGRFAGGI